MGDIRGKSDQGFQREVGNRKRDNNRTSTLNEKELKDKDKERPRTIVLRLANFKDKNIILKNVNKLKGSDVYINEDFSRETTKLRKKLWGKVKQLRSQGKLACLNYRSIITRDQGKK